LLAGCYTDPINREPIVSDIRLEGSDPIFRGVERTYVATASDDGLSSELTYEWGKAAACPPDGDVAAALAAIETGRVGGTTRERVALAAPSMEPFCVFVVVSDRYGARGTLARPFAPIDRPPEGQVFVHGEATPPLAAQPYPLFTKFRIDANVKDPDGDDVSLTWTITGPKGPVAATNCSDAPESRCFQATDEGAYAVDVRDATGKFLAHLDLAVLPDHPPCLTAFQPSPFFRLPRSPSDSQTFSVAVSDDGDPLPVTGGADVHTELVWTVRVGGPTAAPLRVSSWSPQALTYTLPANTFGRYQTVQVTVEAHDRAHGAPDPTTCTPDGTECNAPLRDGTACLSRATWTVEFDL
jgi:hypothetical protein